ncbi:hypothetical protein N0V85_007223 [Neurospora sp. IMI 360204]|nr:hypothetical protein N0V85_007223 [Neurospora sp. IMI 360204]
MFSQRIFAVIVFLTATVIFSASASPVGPPSPVPGNVPPGLVILKRTATPDNGTLTWYGQAAKTTTSYRNETTAYKGLDCRNDQLELTCRDDFAASRDACLDVTNTLTGDKFKKATRSICKTDNKGDQCCISWQDGVSEGEQTTLKGPAEQLVFHCWFLKDGKYMA